MSRPATGSLVWVPRANTWAARYWTLVDSERVRKQVRLGTTNRAAARAKLDRILTGEMHAERAAAPESFAEAARRIVARQRVEGMKDWAARLARLERYAVPEFGQLPVTLVKAEHVREALSRALAAGRGKSTLGHLRVDISTVLGALWRDDKIGENAAKKVQLPKAAKEDKRPRIVPSDEELMKLLTCPRVDPELQVAVLCARTVAGQRASDLMAADWAQIDTQNWATWRVFRPKTETWDVHMIPNVTVPILESWWHSNGRPVRGPLFPVRKGQRQGQTKVRGSGFAERLRDAFWIAGARRPLPGYEQAPTEPERRKLCALQVDTTQTRRVDFHSIRRAYVTAVNRAGTDAATSMRLAAHTHWSTHQRYIDRDRKLSAPAASLPKLSTVRLLPNASHDDMQSKETRGSAVESTEAQGDDSEPEGETAVAAATATTRSIPMTTTGLTSQWSSVQSRARLHNSFAQLALGSTLKNVAPSAISTRQTAKLRFAGFLGSLRGLDRGGELGCLATLERLAGGAS